MTASAKPFSVLRIGYPLLLVFALSWAAIAVFAYGGLSGAPSAPPGTAVQIAAAQDFVTGLPAVAGAEVDPYDTACEQPRTWCLTSTTLTDQQLATEALAVLTAQGASVSSHSCARSRAPRPTCSATLHYRGTRLSLDSDALNIAIALSPSTRSSTTLAVAVDGDTGGGPVQPLGAWSSINPLPAAWPVDPPCITRPAQGAGCDAHELASAAAPAFPGTLATATAAAVASLQAGGFAVHEKCVHTQRLVGSHCVLMITKYWSRGGGDGITGALSVRERSASTVSISVYVAAAAS